MVINFSSMHSFIIHLFNKCFWVSTKCPATGTRIQRQDAFFRWSATLWKSGRPIRQAGQEAGGTEPCSRGHLISYWDFPIASWAWLCPRLFPLNPLSVITRSSLSKALIWSITSPPKALISHCQSSSFHFKDFGLRVDAGIGWDF